MRVLVVVLGFLTVGACQGAQACSDISKFDFRNYTFSAAPGTGKLYGVFNGPARGGELKLRNGVFHQWDWPDGKVPPEYRDKPDWETKIEKDVLVNPKGSQGVRVIVLGKNHLLGTGFFFYVFAFDCHEGGVRKLFEASGEGVNLARVTASELTLAVGIWRPKDSHADPSIRLTVLYRWSPEAQEFVRLTSNAQCPWVP